MRPGNCPRFLVPGLCLWALLLVAAPGCGDDPKAASASIDKALEQRDKSLRERHPKPAPAKPRR